MWTVGRNDRAQLGRHDRVDQIEFRKVPGVFNVTDIALGAGHTLAVTGMSQVGDKLGSITCLLLTRCLTWSGHQRVCRELNNLSVLSVVSNHHRRGATGECLIVWLQK